MTWSVGADDEQSVACHCISKQLTSGGTKLYYDACVGPPGLPAQQGGDGGGCGGGAIACRCQTKDEEQKDL